MIGYMVTIVKVLPNNGAFFEYVRVAVRDDASDDDVLAAAVHRLSVRCCTVERVEDWRLVLKELSV